MKTFTANDLHEKRTEVYQAAVQAPVKITHKHHGDFILQRCGAEKYIIGECGGPEIDVTQGGEIRQFKDNDARGEGTDGFD